MLARPRGPLQAWASLLVLLPWGPGAVIWRLHRALSKSARAGQGRNGRQLPKHLEPSSPPVPPGDNSLFVWGGAPSAHVEPWQEGQAQAVVLSPSCFHRMPGLGAGGHAPPWVSTPLLEGPQEDTLKGFRIVDVHGLGGIFVKQSY